MFYTVSEVLLKRYTISNKSLARYISAFYEKKIHSSLLKLASMCKRLLNSETYGIFWDVIKLFPNDFI